MPTVPQLIEDAFIAALRSAIGAGPIIEASPDDPNAWDAKAAKGCVLVRYHGDRSEEPPVHGPPSARLPVLSICEVHVFVGSRSLRGTDAHRATFDMLATARTTLTGLELTIPENERPSRFYPFGANFHDEINKVWWYVLRMRSTAFRWPST